MFIQKTIHRKHHICEGQWTFLQHLLYFKAKEDKNLVFFYFFVFCICINSKRKALTSFLRFALGHWHTFQFRNRKRNSTSISNYVYAEELFISFIFLFIKNEFKIGRRIYLLLKTILFTTKILEIGNIPQCWQKKTFLMSSDRNIYFLHSFYSNLNK